MGVKKKKKKNNKILSIYKILQIFNMHARNTWSIIKKFKSRLILQILSK